MQNRHIAMGTLLLSLLLSSWLYWGSDFKLEQVLTSREWQSKMVSLIKTNSNSPAIGPLSRVDVTSNVKYLPNGTYLRVSIVTNYSLYSTLELFWKPLLGDAAGRFSRKYKKLHFFYEN